MVAEQTDRELHEIFSRNLRLLASKERSITELCRTLRINRTQFNRYLSGEVSPRPLILHKICEHFKVDARILLEPLKDLQSAPGANLFQDLFAAGAQTPSPAPPDLLPDGLYGEWKPSLHRPDHVNFHMFQISTHQGIRRTRVKCLDALKPKIPGLQNARHKIDYVGIAIAQINGFALVDAPTGGKSVLTLTSFRYGYHFYEHIYPGVKLSSVSYSTQMTHSCLPCFLERLPDDLPARLRAARTPYLQPIDSAPDYVGQILRGIVKTGFVFPTIPGTND